MSGSPGVMFNFDSDLSKNNTASVAEKLGCVKDGDSQSLATLSCMRETPFEELRQTSIQMSHEARPPFGELYFPTVVDGDLFPARPSKLTRAGRFAKGVSLIASWTANEGAWYASPTTTLDEEIMAGIKVWIPRLSSRSMTKLWELYPLDEFHRMVRPHYDGSISPQYYRAAQMSRDIFFSCPILDFTWQYARQEGTGLSNIRLFEHNDTRFTAVFEKMGVPMWRVSHLSDIPYVFNELLEGGADNSPSHMELARLMTSTMVKFANSDTPVGSRSGVEDWPLAYGNANSGSTGSFPSAMALKLFGGQHGTHTVHVLRNQSSATATSSAEQAILNERLFERCEFINSEAFQDEAGV
ncbi:MAG: hypothetical protein Q9162_001074 [Coniocarpon cinnabarinum]